MVTINLGYTAPVNRPGQTPLLTLEHVWAGLQRKVRHAEEFVPLIVACTVLSEESHHESSSETGGEKQVVRRRVRLRAGAAIASGSNGGDDDDADEVTETCELYPPCRVDFRREGPDGFSITNVVTDGPSGDPHDLYLTFVFEWRLPEPGGEGRVAEEELREKYKQTAKMAVESSIERIRGMFSGQAPA